ncbi:MAG: winged helix-turn-helix transcriptional regulator [Promethearchaeota archaeon]
MVNGKKRKAGIIFATVILCVTMIWNIIYIGVVLLTNNNASIMVEGSTISVMEQNDHLIVNDIHPQSTDDMNTVGGSLIISSFFVYFIIATNIQDYNLFPSQVKLNQPTRQKIYQLIEENEGIHLREICRRLEKEMGCIQYHLHILENANLISSMKDGRYKRFFVNYRDIPEERVLIALLKRETTAKVLILIYKHNGDGISHSAIAKQLKSTSQAVTWHIHKLDNANIISITKRGCQKFYQISPDYLPALESVLEKYS